MLYLIIGGLCLAAGGFAGYKLGHNDAEEKILGYMSEEEQEIMEIHLR